MNNSTLLQLFKSLDRNDRRQLRKFVRSPYFNSREDVVALFDYIDKHIDTGGAPKLAKEKAFAAIYKKQKFDVDAFYYPMSHLTQLILKYLTINELENNTPQYQHFLNTALRQRGADKLYEKTLNDTKKHLDNQPLRNAQFHFDSYRTRSEEFEARHRLKRSGDFELQEMTNDFHFYTIAEVLRLAYGLAAHQSITKKEYHQPLLNVVLDVAKQHLDIPAISAHYYAYQTQMKQDTEGVFFQKLKNIITDNQTLFSQVELRDLLTVALNYAIFRQNKGDLSYTREAILLYRWGFDNQVFLENGILSPYDYRNTLQLALKIDEYDWAEKFLNDFKAFLPERERENIYSYNLAIFYFRKKEYELAMSLLQEVNLKEPLFNLDARRLLARTYFELSEFTALDSHIESSKIYLHRQKEIGYGKEAYANFFKFLERLLKLENKSAETRQKLHEEIQQTQLVAEKDWLILQTK
ncbi:MAG: hypothetical protein JNL70_06370 [Saprospiraceae bacterium]|nr:hypothetical protein [Saprospiraceae bacterium]